MDLPVIIQMEDSLRQMLTVLEDERQALAGLNADKLTECTAHKQDLCDLLAKMTPDMADDTCIGLLRSAKELNEVNRKVRNLVAANLAQRLEVLTGAPGLYGAHVQRQAEA